MLYERWTALGLVQNDASSLGPTHGGSSPRFCRSARQSRNRFIVERSASVVSPGSPTSLIIWPLYAGSSSATVHCVAWGRTGWIILKSKSVTVSVYSSVSVYCRSCGSLFVTKRVRVSLCVPLQWMRNFGGVSACESKKR
jgi:hypothetical protein